MARAEQVLWLLNFLATAALLGRIVRCKLSRTYPCLFLYWLAQALAALILFQIPIRTNLYSYAYFVAKSVSLILAVLVVNELYRVALAAHPALSVFGRRSMLAVFGLSATLAGAIAGLDSTVLPGQYALIHRFMTVDRTLQFIFLVFLLAISGFLLWFPVKIQRNLAVYIAGFIVFYSSQSFAFLLNNRLPQHYSQSVSVAAMAMALLCLLIWLIGLRAEGESAATVTGHGWNPAAAARLAAQLEEINTALTRFVRSSARPR